MVEIHGGVGLYRWRSSGAGCRLPTPAMGAAGPLPSGRSPPSSCSSAPAGGLHEARPRPYYATGRRTLCTELAARGTGAMKVGHTDVLVIGGGLALRCAIGARRRGLEVRILSLVPPSVRTRWLPRGGMQASLGNTVRGCTGDNGTCISGTPCPGSDWGCDQLVAHVYPHGTQGGARGSPGWGVPWNRRAQQRRESSMSPAGDTHQRDRPRPDHRPRPAAPASGAPAIPRTAPVTPCCTRWGDRAVWPESIPVDRRCEGDCADPTAGRCGRGGARPGQRRALGLAGQRHGDLAGGSAASTGCRPMPSSTKASALRSRSRPGGAARQHGGGAVPSHRHRAGLASSSPKAVAVTAAGCCATWLATASCPTTNPRRPSSPRDVVSRRMAERTCAAAARASGRRAGAPVARHHRPGRRPIDRKLREVRDICHHFLGIDPARGGFRCDLPSTTRWAASAPDHRGESHAAASSPAARRPAGICGFNRLGGNLGGRDRGRRHAGGHHGRPCARRGSAIRLSPALARAFIAREQAALEAILARPAEEDAHAIRRAMEATMTEQVGLFRDEAGLATAVETLTGLLARAGRIGTRQQAPQPQNRCSARACRRCSSWRWWRPRRAGAAREPRPPPRGTIRAQRPRLAQAHPGELAGGQPTFPEYEPIGGRGHGTAAAFRGYGHHRASAPPRSSATQAQRRASRR